MTAQAAERIVIADEEYLLLSEPLESYLKNRKFKFDVPNTACWRGYIGKWELKNKELHLIGFDGAIKGKDVDLNYLFPNVSSIKADWFTGRLRIPIGEMIKYFPAGYASKYLDEMFIEIEKGNVVSTKFEHNSMKKKKIQAKICLNDESNPFDPYLKDCILNGNYNPFDAYVKECLLKGMTEDDITQEFIPTDYLGETNPITIRLFNVMNKNWNRSRYLLGEFYAFSVEDLRKYRKYFSWVLLFNNKFLDWSEELLIEFKEELDEYTHFSKECLSATLMAAKGKSDKQFIMKAVEMGYINQQQYDEYYSVERKEEPAVYVNPPKEIDEIISAIEQTNWKKLNYRRGQVFNKFKSLFDNLSENGFDYTFNTPEKKMILDNAVKMFVKERCNQWLRDELRIEIINSIKRLEVLQHISVFNGNWRTGQIDIKAYPGDGNEIVFKISAWGIKVDWGDGKIKERINSDDYKTIEFRHKFTNDDLQTITVNTIRMNEFGCQNGSLEIDKGTFCELRFSNCSELEEIWASDYNNIGQLTVLEIDKAESLRGLFCDGNCLTSLDVSNCLALEYINCQNNQLASLNISNCPELTHLECSNNQLSAFEINSFLYDLPIHESVQNENEYPADCDWRVSLEKNPGYDNYDKSILEKKGWEEKIIFADNNNLQTGEIKIKAYPDEMNRIAFNIQAKELMIDWGDNSGSFIDEQNGVDKNFSHEYSNQNLQTIKVSTDEMTSFTCDSNFPDIFGTFQELRFGNCPELQGLKCDKQSLTVLEINKAESMFYLGCSENQLNSLDVSGCPALTFLDCWGNQLTSLDVSKCLNLNLLQCQDNEFSESSLNALLKSLPERGFDNKGMITCGEGYNVCDISFAEKRGWSVQLFLEKTTITDEESEDNMT